MRANICNYDISFEFSLKDETKKEWEDFWSVSEHSYPHQHHVYGEIEKAKKRIPIYVLGRIGGKLSFIGLFSIRPLWGKYYSDEAVCLRGPVFDDLDFGQWCLQNIIQYFNKLGVGSVRVGPNWTFPEAEKMEYSLFNLGFSIYETSLKLGRRSTGLVFIDRPDDELLMSFHKSTRYEIRRAERFNVVVRAADKNAEADIFYRQLKNMNRNRGVTCYTTKEFQTMYQAILKDKELGVIFNAYNEGNYLGGLLVLKGASVAYTVKFVVLNKMVMELKNLRLAPIAFWHGMLWAKKRGCRYLDLEGYSSNIEEAGHLKYIYEYKKGFNPTEICTLGQYSIKCNKIIFCISKACCKIENGCKKPWRLLFKIRTWFINWKIYRRRVQGTQ
jgi:hypothetical protein